MTTSPSPLTTSLLTRWDHPQALEVLLAPQRWTLIGPRGLAEVPPVPSPQHARWMRSHSHAHPRPEICLVVSGHMDYGCGGQVYALGPGSLMVFDAFDAHDESPAPFTHEVDQLWFAVLRDCVAVRLIRVRQGVYSMAGEWSHLIDRAELDVVDCRSLLDTRRPAEAGVEVRRLRLKAAVALLVSHLLAAGARPLVTQTTESFQGRVITAICEHIDETAGVGESLDSLARLAGYSKYHFLRLFQRHTGLSVHRYIDRCRWQRAQHLRGQGSSQREIAAALGFSSAAVYARWLKRHSERRGLEADGEPVC